MTYEINTFSHREKARTLLYLKRTGSVADREQRGTGRTPR